VAYCGNVCYDGLDKVKLHPAVLEAVARARAWRGWTDNNYGSAPAV